MAIFDVPGAYLHANMPEDKFAVIKFENEFVDIMCEINKELIEDIKYEKGKKVLYMRILKALYGCIESALLWYNLWKSTLESMGFEINPYDRCVGNKMINGSQCTIAWYVDDVKISHKSEEVLTDIIKKVENKFGPLSVSRGKFIHFENEFYP